ncbi:MAG: DUF255 domain-containing protein [Alphaproteobacteria bacterium]|nr:DUF255 domain-containing protein [Alphaproteobacteria bacterium]
MRFRYDWAAVLILSAVGTLTANASVNSSDRAWATWDNRIFETAKAEKRFVLLDLEAVWCHWCHVMRRQTYADPRVKNLISKHYLPVRVDQDAHPDLSNRYGDWGWPATIVFAPDGSEIVKLRGFIPPARMVSLLQAIVDDPSPGPSVLAELSLNQAKLPSIDGELHAILQKRFFESYDGANGGWGSLHKYIDADSMDYAMSLAQDGNKQASKMMRQTLNAGRNLIDPVGGGVYQYSDAQDWRSPHYEKIMFYQASYLRHYANAYAFEGRGQDLKSAKLIVDYLKYVLRGPDGGFFTSQDADVDDSMHGKEFYSLSREERKALGRQPRIDRNLYARENGWAICGLVAYSDAAGDAQALMLSEAAANWVVANRAIEGGGFKHGEHDQGGPYLGDSVAMGQAFVSLYAATGKRDWLDKAARTGRFIISSFNTSDGGFQTSASQAINIGVFSEGVREYGEQVATARLLNALFRYTGEKSFKEAATKNLQFLQTPKFLANGFPRPGIQLLKREIDNEPVHITIVGHKGDPRAKALHAEARKYPAIYKRLDWWDKREGPLTNPDVTYPEMDRAAGFACSQRICSLPAFSAGELRAAIDRLKR